MGCVVCVYACVFFVVCCLSGLVVGCGVCLCVFCCCFLCFCVVFLFFFFCLLFVFLGYCLVVCCVVFGVGFGGCSLLFWCWWLVGFFVVFCVFG